MFKICLDWHFTAWTNKKCTAPSFSCSQLLNSSTPFRNHKAHDLENDSTWPHTTNIQNILGHIPDIVPNTQVGRKPRCRQSVPYVQIISVGARDVSGAAAQHKLGTLLQSPSPFCLSPKIYWQRAVMGFLAFSTQSTNQDTWQETVSDKQCTELISRRLYLQSLSFDIHTSHSLNTACLWKPLIIKMVPFIQSTAWESG